MENSSYYCPASLSFIFKYCPDKNLMKMGSIGVGCTIDKGVIVSANLSDKTNIIFNKKIINFPTINTVIRYLTDKPLTIDIKSSLPLGFGFGISGASALASAFAINNLLNLKMKKSRLIEIAHIAEIENHTGLGSVGTQATGGFLIKTAPGIPVHARELPLEKQQLYAIMIGRLLTPSVLKDNNKLDKINSIASKKLEKIRQLTTPALSEILDISFEFVEECGLANREVIGIIRKIKEKGAHATMAILGHVILSSCPPADNIKYEVQELTITKAKLKHLL